VRSQLICGRFIGESIGRESVRGERKRNKDEMFKKLFQDRNQKSAERSGQ